MARKFRYIIPFILVIIVSLTLATPVYAWDPPRGNPPVMPTPPQPLSQQNQWWNSGTRTQTRNGNLTEIPSPPRSPHFQIAQSFVPVLPVIISPQSLNPENRIHVSRYDSWPHLTVQARREDFSPRTGHVPYQGQTTIDMFTRGGVANRVVEERIRNYPNTFPNSGLNWQQVNWRR